VLSRTIFFSRLKRLVPIALVLVFAGPFSGTPAWAALSHDASLNWKTLHTRHFRVHFHDGEEELAREAARIAEHTHNWVSPLFDWSPADPTDIILSDEVGVSNGFATPVPTNRSGIYVAPPDRLNSLEDHAGWLETVITHEYVHIIHLDKARGAPKGLRKVFGRFPFPLPFSVFPNAFQPVWLVEGLATYYETDTQRGIGRGQSSYYDMLMRMEVARGLKPVRQVNQPLVSWPGGTAWYLYGVHFYEFVKQNKGDEKIQALVQDYSNDFIPYRVNANTKSVFGKGQGALWKEYSAYLEKKFRAQIREIEARGPREGDALTDRGYEAGSLRAGSDGTLYYIRDDWQSAGALMALRPGEKKARRLRRVNYGATIDLHPQAGILLAQAEFCTNARIHFDLYRVDPRNGRSRRLTRCGRYHYGAWAPDGQSIIAAELTLGRSRLVRLDAQGKKPEILWTGKSGEVISGLDWSPDGRALVAALWRPEQGWDLEEFVLAEGRWRRLTRDATIEMQARYSDDGRRVFFTSDHGGVYNIRELDLATGRTVTLTDVRGGAFEPAMDERNKRLYYIGYRGSGFDVFELVLSDREPLATPPSAQGPSGRVLRNLAPLEDTRLTGYSPWSSLYPRWWFPSLSLSDATTEVGVLTSGWDVLQRHIYFLNLGYDFRNNWPVGSFDYIYDRWPPVFKLHASRFNDLKRDGDNETERVRRDDVYQAELVFPLVRFWRRFSFHLSALKDRQSDGWVDKGVAKVPTVEDNLVGAAGVYDSANRYPRSVSRADGRYIRLVAEDSDIIEGGDFTGSVYTLDWREYFRIYGEHVLGLRAVMGWGTENPRPFELGGSDSADAFPPYLGSSVINSPFNRRDYALRGYSTGEPRLIGRRMQLASLEYRFPLYLMERGITIPPLGLHRVWGDVFVDTGGAWNDDDTTADKYYTGAGIEARAEAVLLYGLLIDLRLGVAYGFDDEIGGVQVYLQTGSSF